MDKRVGHGPLGRDAENSPIDRGVVDLADARVKIRSLVRPTTESLTHELDEVRSLLDQGLSTEAKARLALRAFRHTRTTRSLSRFSGGSFDVRNSRVTCEARRGNGQLSPRSNRSRL